MNTPNSNPPYLHCPNCQYDVSQTLRDRIHTCPECGNGLTPARCITVYPREPIHIRLICKTMAFVASFATTFAAIALLAGSDPMIPLLVIGASLALLIVPSRLRIRLPPQAPFPRVPFEYFIHYSCMVLFIAAITLFLFWGLLLATTRP